MFQDTEEDEEKEENEEDVEEREKENNTKEWLPGERSEKRISQWVEGVFSLHEDQERTDWCSSPTPSTPPCLSFPSINEGEGWQKGDCEREREPSWKLGEGGKEWQKGDCERERESGRKQGEGKQEEGKQEEGEGWQKGDCEREREPSWKLGEGLAERGGERESWRLEEGWKKGLKGGE